jgi:hypothetical protein
MEKNLTITLSDGFDCFKVEKWKNISLNGLFIFSSTNLQP